MDLCFGIPDELFFRFFFKQKTAYEMRISDWVQTCAHPIFPRRLVMLRDEAHRVEEREAQHRAQHQRQGLVEHAMTICPGQQHAVNDDLEQGFTDMDRPVAAIELADRIQQIEVQEDRKSTRLNYSH